MKHVITHHAHHPDEGVYRLIYAEAHPFSYVLPNPDFDPDEEPSEDNSPHQTVEDVAYSNHQDIVWAADDERWDAMTPNDIAKEQRADVTEALAAQSAQAREDAVAEANRRASIRPVGEVGIEL
jgi:hypothetical protein